MNTLKRFFEEIMVSYAALTVWSVSILFFFVDKVLKEDASSNWNILFIFMVLWSAWDTVTYWNKFKNGGK